LDNQTQESGHQGNTPAPQTQATDEQGTTLPAEVVEMTPPVGRNVKTQIVVAKPTDLVLSGGPIIKVAEGEDTLIDATQFTEQQMAWARSEAEKLPWDDTNMIMLFGSAPQQELGSFVDVLIGDMKVGEAGPVGDITVALASGIDEVRLEKFQAQMQDGRSLWAKLPGIGRWFDYARIFMAKQGSFRKLIDEIIQKAEDRRNILIRKNAELDALYDRNQDTTDAMALAIIAGQFALEIGEARHRELTSKAKDSGDPRDTQDATDFGEALQSFRVRLADMKTFYLRSMLNGPQIRTTQQASRIEMQNITRSILGDVNRLKTAIVMAAANYAILQAQAEREARKGAMERIEKVAAESTGQAYVAAKESQGDALDDAKHLNDIAQTLMASLERGAELDVENRAKMVEAAQVLAQTKDFMLTGMQKLQQQAIEE